MSGCRWAVFGALFLFSGYVLLLSNKTKQWAAEFKLNSTATAVAFTTDRCGSLVFLQRVLSRTVTEAGRYTSFVVDVLVLFAVYEANVTSLSPVSPALRIRRSIH